MEEHKIIEDLLKKYKRKYVKVESIDYTLYPFAPMNSTFIGKYKHSVTPDIKGDYLLIDGVVYHDNINKFYKFMNTTTKLEHKDLLKNIHSQRWKKIVDFLKKEGHIFEVKEDIWDNDFIHNNFEFKKLDFDFPITYYEETSYFGIKDILLPIDEYIEQIKNSDEYKKAVIKKKESKNMKNTLSINNTESIKNETEPILIKSIQIEGKTWFDKMNGNTYHVSRAIINNEHTITHNKMTYGYDNQYEVTIAKDMEKLGITGVSKTSLWRFCDENNIEFSSSSKEGLKRDLCFKDYENRDYYKEVDSNVKFITQSDLNFKELADLINKEYKNSSNESKAIALYIETMISDLKISDVPKRINELYDIKLNDLSASLVGINDVDMIKSVYRASMDMDIEFDFTRKDITLKDIYNGYKDVLNDSIKTFKDLKANNKVEFFEKRVGLVDELIKKYDEKQLQNNDSSISSTENIESIDSNKKSRVNR